MSTEPRTSALVGLLGSGLAFSLGVAMTLSALYAHKAYTEAAEVAAWEAQSRCEASDRPEVCAAMRAYEAQLGRPFVPAEH